MSRTRSFAFLFCSLAALALFPHCSTGPRVLESADDNSHPSWAAVTVPSYEEHGKKYFLGYVELDGNASKSGALNVSDEKALSEPMRALVDQFLDQNQVGEDLRKEGTIGRRIISATRGYRPPMPALTIVKRYWERLEVDEYHSVLRAYSLAEIPVTDFERAKQAYFDRLAGNSEMKVILNDVGRRQRDNILDASSSQKTGAKAD